MTTTINSNGSKWAGSSPDSIEKLKEVLQSYALDPTFEKFGNFIITDAQPLSKNVSRFFGNFFELSHVFNIDTSDDETRAELTRLIRENQKTPEYKKAREDRLSPSYFHPTGENLPAMPPQYELGSWVCECCNGAIPNNWKSCPFCTCPNKAKHYAIKVSRSRCTSCGFDHTEPFPETGYK